MPWKRWSAALAVQLAMACSHAKPQMKPDPPRAAPVAAAPAPVAAPAAVPAPSRSCGTDDDCRANELCVAARCSPIAPDVPECRTASAHFEFDRSNLEDSELPLLRRAARCASALPSETTLVAGHCDERGTTQYNVALGFRRAAAVARYLGELGVEADRLHSVSYGEESPACSESTEPCWARNRRADVTVGTASQTASK